MYLSEYECVYVCIPLLASLSLEVPLYALINEPPLCFMVNCARNGNHQCSHTHLLPNADCLAVEFIWHLRAWELWMRAHNYYNHQALRSQLESTVLDHEIMTSRVHTAVCFTLPIALYHASTFHRGYIHHKAF